MAYLQPHLHHPPRSVSIMILDVGCGSTPKGHVNIDLFFTPEHRAGETEGLDAKKIPNFVIADAEHLPFRKNTFSTVHSAHLLEHCLNPVKVLTEFKRVSQKTVYIRLPGPRSPNDCPYHLFSWDPHTFRNLLQRVFFSVRVYSFENYIHILRNRGKSPLTVVGNFLFLIRRSQFFIKRNSEMIAICRKKEAEKV